MRLRDLINQSCMKVFGDDSIEISGLSCDSQKCKIGDVFFALDGVNVDGTKFCDLAIQNGAVAVVSKKRIENLPDGICNVVCKNERKAMSEMSACFFNFPSRELFIIGVTGTNGKTTITYMLESIFKNAGKNVAVVGTNGVRFCGQKFETNMTTPDPILLQSLLAKMRDCGVQVVCMEISAHALELQKNWGVMTDIALFSNLSQDHLDFFFDMKKYHKAKAKLFKKESAIVGVVNVDDKSGEKLYREAEIPILTFSCSGKSASIRASEICEFENFQIFKVEVLGETQIAKLKLLGKFNISNALASIGAGFVFGLQLETILDGLEKLEEVEGRFNCFEKDGVKMIVDFAHTPDGLENILKVAKEMTKGKLLSVFGCGGNRDKLKRPIMGQISEHLATYTIITSDNPRFEEPLEIAKEIEKGMKENSHEIVLEREEAILKAFSMAEKGDVIVISGKGAEKFIEKNGEKIPFEDKNVILKIKKNQNENTNTNKEGA